MAATRLRSLAIAAVLLSAACAQQPPSATSGPTPTAEPTSCPPPSSSPSPSPSQRPPTATPRPTVVPSGRAGPAPYWDTIPTSDKVVALTVDCGGDAAGIPKILAALDTTQAPATFFLTGRWVEHFPDEAKRIASRYPLGNHTYDHPHMTKIDDAAIRDQIEDAGRAVQEVTGIAPTELFRFPYGERDDRTLQVVGSYGFTAIGWTVDTVGWKGREGGVRSAATVADRVIGALQPGMIVLMHAGAATDGSTLDADALPQIVSRARAKGYRFVRIDGYL
jgi:peptidoglycan/xylan/chitin deacetylase (PgdA/CDA1 family)